MTAPVRYRPRLDEALVRAAECYRRRDDAGVEEWLGEAIRLAPWRTDLRFCLAGRHIQHGVPEAAVEVYEEVLGRVPGDAEALFFSAHWRRFLGDAAAAARLDELERRSPGKARALRALWRLIDKWEAVSPSDAVPELPAGSSRPALLVLGYLLNDDGTPHPALVGRLEKALAVSARYPDAALVVSGGVPRAGRVEAVVMREWLEARGVPSGRIFEEGYSRDVVENLIFSRQIVAALGADGVVAVTAAINVRRTGVGLDILSESNGLGWAVKVAAAGGETFSEYRDDGRDRLKTYRDALRCFGIPMMSAYPHLAER